MYPMLTILIESVIFILCFISVWEASRERECPTREQTVVGTMLLILLLAIGAGKLVPPLKDKVTITALNKKGEESNGKNVALLGFNVDGLEFSIPTPVEGQWNWSGAYYAWQAETEAKYPETVTRSVTFEIPVGSKRSVRFYTGNQENSGYAQIQMFSGNYSLLSIVDTSKVSVEYLAGNTQSRLLWNSFRRALAFIGITLLFTFALHYALHTPEKWGHAWKRYISLWRNLRGWKYALFYTLHYTILFLLVSRFVFAPFWDTGKSFVYNYDGISQHLPRMVYTGKTLREGIRAVLSGQKWSYPFYDFHNGIVSSNLPTDLLYFVLAFIPTDATVVFYHVYIMLMYYSLGLAFSYFGHYFKQKPLPILTGAISYTFCGHALNVVIRHMMFGPAMALLPLLIVGADRVLKKERAWLLLICVFLSLKTGSIGLYFSCMSALFVLLYLCVRFFDCYEVDRGREFLKLIGRLFIWGGIGILLAGFSIVPSLFAVGGTGRVGVDVSSFTNLLSYNDVFYEKFLTQFIIYPQEFSNYLTLGFSVLCLPAVILLFLSHDRKTRALKIFFTVMTLMLVIPGVTYVMSGFSHLSNRYIFGYAFCVNAILMFMLPRLAKADRKTMFLLIAILLTYTVTACFIVSKSSRYPIVLILLLFTVIVFQLYDRIEQKQSNRLFALCLAVTCFSVSFTGYLKYSPRELNYVGTYLNHTEPISTAGQYYALSQNADVQSDESFFRVAGDHLAVSDLNAAALYGLNGLTAYASTGISSAFSQWLREMEMPDYSTMLRIYGLDTRSPELSLAGVKYYARLSELKAPTPYGFEKIGEIHGGDSTTRIYRNLNALPIGYTYSRYIGRNNYDNLNALAKQETQLKSIVLEESPTLEGLTEWKGSNTSKRLDYTIKDSQTVTWKNGILNVKKNGGKLELRFNGLPEEETYLRVVGLDLTSGGSTRQWMLTAYTKTTSAHAYFMADAYMYADGKHTQMLDLGRSNNGFKTVTLYFPSAGTYRLEDLEIWSQPTKGYAPSLAALREESLENVEVDTNSLKGTISVSTDKLLCLAIPYTKGWTAWVDGAPTKLYRANTAFMAVELRPGDHTVELRYSKPWLKAGIAVSALGLLCVICIILFGSKMGKLSSRPYHVHK